MSNTEQVSDNESDNQTVQVDKKPESVLLEEWRKRLINMDNSSPSSNSYTLRESQENDQLSKSRQSEGAKKKKQIYLDHAELPAIPQELIDKFISEDTSQLKPLERITRECLILENKLDEATLRDLILSPESKNIWTDMAEALGSTPRTLKKYAKNHDLLFSEVITLVEIATHYESNMQTVGRALNTHGVNIDNVSYLFEARNIINREAPIPIKNGRYVRKGLPRIFQASINQLSIALEHFSDLVPDSDSLFKYGEQAYKFFQVGSIWQSIAAATKYAQENDIFVTTELFEVAAYFNGSAESTDVNPDQDILTNLDELDLIQNGALLKSKGGSGEVPRKEQTTSIEEQEWSPTELPNELSGDDWL